MAHSYAHIACCVDQSDASMAALRRASRLHRPGVRLSVVHVAPPTAVLLGGLGGWEPDEDDPVGPPRRWLESVAATVPDAIPVLLGEDDPVAAAADWLRHSGADLAVCAPHQGALQALVLGSFARELIYRSPVDVLVVPPSADDGPGDGVFRHIACCIEESDGSTHALNAAAAMAEASGAELTILTVVSPPRMLPRRIVAESLPIPLDRENRALSLLGRASAAVGGAATELLAGPPEGTVREWAAGHDVDLLVVGPRSGRRPGLGGFAQNLAGDAPCALLFARPGDAILPVGAPTA